MKKEIPWKTAPISRTCEFNSLRGVECKCGNPTEYCYPAWGGGWMALCEKHGRKHENGPGTEKAVDLIAKGETWA